MVNSLPSAGQGKIHRTVIFIWRTSLSTSEEGRVATDTEEKGSPSVGQGQNSATVRQPETGYLTINQILCGSIRSAVKAALSLGTKYSRESG